MFKQISPSAFILLPSGDQVHPQRLIQRDGTIMWKHALYGNSKYYLPINLAHEAHIIKTAARLEELNSWVSQNLDPWDCLIPKFWYDPLSEHSPIASGYACEFQHLSISNDDVLCTLCPHVQDHETLKELSNGNLYFSRC
jgi:hypothetical protein